MERNAARIWLTPQEVGNMTGFSASFIRREIALNALPAQWINSRAGKCGRWRIHREDAKAYAIKLGVWRARRSRGMKVVRRNDDPWLVVGEIENALQMGRCRCSAYDDEDDLVAWGCSDCRSRWVYDIHRLKTVRGIEIAKARAREQSVRALEAEMPCGCGHARHEGQCVECSCGALTINRPHRAHRA